MKIPSGNRPLSLGNSLDPKRDELIVYNIRIPHSSKYWKNRKDFITAGVWIALDKPQWKRWNPSTCTCKSGYLHT